MGSGPYFQHRGHRTRAIFSVHREALQKVPNITSGDLVMALSRLSSGSGTAKEMLVNSALGEGPFWAVQSGPSMKVVLVRRGWEARTAISICSLETTWKSLVVRSQSLVGMLWITILDHLTHSRKMDTGDKDPNTHQAHAGYIGSTDNK